MSDQKLSQLQRTFFKIDDSEANNMNQFIPRSNLSFPSSNSNNPFTNFKNPKNLNAIVKDNGPINTSNRHIIKYQQPLKTEDEQDSRMQNALIDIASERTNNTPQVNELKNRVIVTQLSIDSKFRKNYFSTSSTDFNIDLSTPLKNVISMRLASLEIPNVSPSISSNKGTNGFTITKNATTTPISIPSGNYEGWILASALNDISGGQLDFLGFNCYIDEKSLKCTIKSSDYNDFKIDFTNFQNPNAPPMMSLGWMLGFRNKIYEGGNCYTGEATIDLAGSKYFFLSINDFQNSVHDVVTVLYENSFMQQNILARIPMREGKGVVLFDDCTDKITKKRHYFGPVDINKLHIKLLDEFGETLDMVGNDYSFALEFQILYEK
tara:strand:+ start:3608 stop:4744 length:1137 start_codon:yes stop_codon:yes gene_type:complete